MEKHELQKTLFALWIIGVGVVLVHNFDFAHLLVDSTTAVLLVLCLLLVHSVRLMIDRYNLRITPAVNLLLHSVELSFIIFPVVTYIIGISELYDNVTTNQHVIVGTANILILLCSELVLLIIRDNFQK